VKSYIAFPLESGEKVIVEVEEAESEYGSVKVGRPEEVAKTAAMTFDRALDQVRPAIGVVIEKLRMLRPDELTIEFGLKLNAEAGAFLASAGAEANFNVSVVWKSERPSKPETD
jgi:hypothetical protein